MDQGFRDGPERERKTIMFGNLKRLAKTYRAPAAGERELVYIAAATDRYDLEARERHVARGACAFGG
jgi:hypothetical protein